MTALQHQPPPMPFFINIKYGWLDGVDLHAALTACLGCIVIVCGFAHHVNPLVILSACVDVALITLSPNDANHRANQVTLLLAGLSLAATNLLAPLVHFHEGLRAMTIVLLAFGGFYVRRFSSRLLFFPIFCAISLIITSVLIPPELAIENIVMGVISFGVTFIFWCYITPIFVLPQQQDSGMHVLYRIYQHIVPLRQSFVAQTLASQQPQHYRQLAQIHDRIINLLDHIKSGEPESLNFNDHNLMTQFELFKVIRRIHLSLHALDMNDISEEIFLTIDYLLALLQTIFLQMIDTSSNQLAAPIATLSEHAEKFEQQIRRLPSLNHFEYYHFVISLQRLVPLLSRLQNA